MYFQPYGDEQQLNLNWIINEIINLHKQLDPDYETPSFTQVYPYSNLNRLNLDWILSELKALKELAPEPTPTIDIQAVAEALVALPFDSDTPYQIYDFISREGEIWRATEAIAAGSEWNISQWYKTKLGTDLAVLERWINSINNSLSGEIEARKNADTTLQTNIDNEALARQQADTALQNTINGLTSANISDDSDAGGATVKASLNNLKGSLNAVQGQITAYVETGNTSSRSYAVGELLVWNGALFRVKQPITSSGVTLTSGTNIEPITINAMLNPITAAVTLDQTNTTGGSLRATKTGNILIIDGYVVLNNSVAGKDAVLATLPDGYRPIFEKGFRAYATYASTSGFFNFTLKSNGEIVTAAGSNIFTGVIYFPSVVFAL